MARDDGARLFLFAGGSAGTELATRLAHRAGGAVLTDALSVEAQPGPPALPQERLLRSPGGTLRAHRLPLVRHASTPRGTTGRCPYLTSTTIVSDSDETGGPAESLFEDLELVDLPSNGDLAGQPVPRGRGVRSAGAARGWSGSQRRPRLMGATFGVSRPVAMNAWAPMDRLIGVSGTRAAPELCIVVGASGAPAFYWGIEKAAFIVAIDTGRARPDRQERGRGRHGRRRGRHRGAGEDHCRCTKERLRRRQLGLGHDVARHRRQVLFE